jgi:CRISPR-associated protein Cmr3
MYPLWRSADLLRWLGGGALDRAIGVAEPPVERRTHVAIDPASGRARDGMLFSVAGRRLVVDLDGAPAAIGLGLRTSVDLAEGVAAAGGERRLVRWRKATGTPLPGIPEAVRRSANAGAVRVLLATPGIFAEGWRPRSLFGAPAGSRVVAACAGRAEVVSGWDLSTWPGRPKPTRRCAPAGSVYFLELGGTASERDTWARTTWLAPCSDAADARTDGFGAVLLGTWDGLLAMPQSSRS